MNRHEIYLWEATQADLSKGFYELSEKAITYARQQKNPSENLLAFAEALNEHRKTVDYNRSFFREVANQIKNATTKAITIEFSEEEDWKRPLRDMVKLAQNFHVMIVDTEITMVFLPTGEIKPFGAEYDWEDLLGELTQVDDVDIAYKKTNLPTTEYDYAVWMRGLLDKGLGEYGFKLANTKDNKNNNVYESWYCRDVEIGKQYIQFTHVGSSPYFWNHTRFYMKCHAASDIYHKFNFDKDGQGVFSIGLEAFTDVNYCRASPLSERLAQCHINDVINYIIKLIFDKITDIKGLDGFVNGWLSKQPLSYMETIKSPPQHSQNSERAFLTPDRFRGMGFYCPQQLIIACIANNPEYAKLKIFFEANKSFGANGLARATEWPKLVKYLEEEINPETFWQQYALLKEEEKRLEEDRIQQLITQFKLNPDEELIPVSDQWYDSQTNLIWQRCCIGQHWQNGQIAGKAELLSWDEKETYLERFKDTGWRLPTRAELQGLSFSRNVGYITKNGFGFYDQIECSFGQHWIEPHKPYGISHRGDICILSTSPRGGTSKFSDDPNLVGYLRLVKSVHKQA